MNKKKFKRRQLIIKKSFQIKYAVIVFLAVMVTAFAVGADFYISIQAFAGEYLQEIPGAEKYMQSMNQIMYGKILVLMVIAVVISFIVSHKFAGPVFKLEKSMDKVKKGDLTHKMYLREGDEFTRLAEIFNGLVSEFRESVELDRRLAADIKSELEEIEPSLDAETKEKVEAIKEKADKITGDWIIKEKNC
ncbi:MAG: HAMP domain-containing protein [Elusimicrobiota bacterium]|nr:HAMP domain-containing protein [Elusimicrobiota bacterium]